MLLSKFSSSTDSTVVADLLRSFYVHAYTIAGRVVNAGMTIEREVDTKEEIYLNVFLLINVLLLQDITSSKVYRP